MPRTGFRPSLHGFPFPNCFPRGTPVIGIGHYGLGDAAGGLCGGMTLAALDYVLHGLPRPAGPTPELFRYLCRRLLDSWNLPFGVLRYYDWQRRPDASRFVAGERVLSGVTRLTVEEEWPKVKAALDAGMPVPLGLVNPHSFDPRELPRNHQVLAYGYEFDGDDLTLNVYDPNWANDDAVALKIQLSESDLGQPVVHTHQGPTVRGFFLTEYRKPTDPPPGRSEQSIP